MNTCNFLSVSEMDVFHVFQFPKERIKGFKNVTCSIMSVRTLVSVFRLFFSWVYSLKRDLSLFPLAQTCLLSHLFTVIVISGALTQRFHYGGAGVYHRDVMSEPYLTYAGKDIQNNVPVSGGQMCMTEVSTANCAGFDEQKEDTILYPLLRNNTTRASVTKFGLIFCWHVWEAIFSCFVARNCKKDRFLGQPLSYLDSNLQGQMCWYLETR